MKTKWTDNETDGLYTFFYIEGAVVFGLAFLAAVVGGLGGPVQTLGEGYFKYATGMGSWFGALSLPASVAGMYVGAFAKNRARPRAAEMGRVLAIEVVVIAFMAVYSVELGPAVGDPAPQWSDLRVFAMVLLVMSLLSLLGAFIALAWIESAAARRAARKK